VPWLNLVYGLAYAELGIVVVAMIWNGVHGRGYKIPGRLPPFRTGGGVIYRLLLLAAMVPLLTFVVGQQSSNFTDPYTWFYAADIIVLILLAAIATAVGASIRRRRNRGVNPDRNRDIGQ
jgi:hypothetical protein